MLLRQERKISVVLLTRNAQNFIPVLFGDHLEGDTEVMFHAKHADIKGPGNIKSLHKVISGLIQDQTLIANYADISNLFKELDYVKARPGIFAYTGINYLPAFYRKGKVRPLLLMAKKAKICGCSCGFGQLRSIRKYHADIEKFTCLMYGYPKRKCINDVLKAEFEDASQSQERILQISLNP